MAINLITYVTQRTGIQKESVESTIKLLEEGATIPFIARYRKEWSGNLDEVQIESIQIEKYRFEEIEKRKATILKSIEEQDKLTEELKERF